VAPVAGSGYRRPRPGNGAADRPGGSHSGHLAFAERDLRLLNAANRWVSRYGDWVNQARLKRMVTSFIESDGHVRRPLIGKDIWIKIVLIPHLHLHPKRKQQTPSEPTAP